MYMPTDNEIFHVHTRRCKHASDEEDFEYVEAALKLGASRIVFTDHSPFEGDIFGNRMDYSELQEYVQSINSLKNQYRDRIEIMCGLELEYMPEFLDYYKRLREMKGIDLLIVGQHFYAHSRGSYSFADSDKTFEFQGQANAMAEAIETGLFDVIAHPDRSFRACEIMGDKEIEAAKWIIEAALAQKQKIPYFEKNIGSTRVKNQYKPEFWENLPANIEVITGYDAHCTEQIIDGWKYVNSDEGIKYMHLRK